MVLILYMLRQAPSGGHDLHSSNNGLCLILHMAALVISAILDVVMVAIIIDSLGPNGSYMSTFFSHNDTLIHIVGLLLVRILAVTAALILMIVCCCASPAKIDWDAR